MSRSAQRELNTADAMRSAWNHYAWIWIGRGKVYVNRTWASNR